MRVMKRFYIVFAIVFSMPLYGCFTGIESTPKITANDVKREHITIPAEQDYLDSVSQQRFERWQYGKRFYVTDNKISLIFQPSKATPPRAGSVITYVGYEPTISVTGTTETDIIFKTETGENFIYHMTFSPEELASKEKVEVPFTIEESIVDEVKEKLSGNQYYILTPTWYNMDGYMIKGQRFILVTVMDVLPGNQIYPVKIVFLPNTSNDRYQLFMSIGNSKQATRNFETLFSFNNPKNKYSQISDDVWDNIINSRVALDMTRNECRLALGPPKEITRRPTTGGLYEQWSYDDGKYLIFEDGILRGFRQ